MTVAHAGSGRMGRWVLAPSLIAMEAEANRIAPNRSRLSDGSIGDADHASRISDHNPDEEGALDYVDAIDLTHDPVGGFDAHAQARSVARNISNGVETRIDYIISNRQIFSQRGGVWAWRPYTGKNPHDHHAHFSVKDSGRLGTGPFFSAAIPFPTPPVAPPHLIEDTPMNMYRCSVTGHKDEGQVWLAFDDGFRQAVNGGAEFGITQRLIERDWGGEYIPLVVSDEWDVFTWVWKVRPR